MSEEVKNKSEYLVEVRDLKQYFPIKTGFMKTTPLKAVDGVSFSIKPGETLGLVGAAVSQTEHIAVLSFFDRGEEKAPSGAETIEVGQMTIAVEYSLETDFICFVYFCKMALIANLIPLSVNNRHSALRKRIIVGISCIFAANKNRAG